jgi:hypothetical protein
MQQQFDKSTFQGIFKIDNIDFTAGLINISRKVNILDRYAERTINGDLKREILGVYYNYSLTFSQFWDMNQYDKLFSKLTEPKEFHTIYLPKNTGYYKFRGYIAGVEDVIEFSRNASERIITGLKNVYLTLLLIT